MQNFPAPLQQFQQFRLLRIGNYTLQEWFNRHWLKACLFLFVAYIVTQKDLSFSVNMRNVDADTSIGAPSSLANSHTTKKHPQKTNTDNIADNTSEIAEASVGGGLLELGAGSKAAAKGSRSTKSAAVGNTMSNLAPILNPAYIKKHNIDPILVNQKMEVCREYVKAHAPAAVREMHSYSIPASITLAQGLLESNAGSSNLANKANNHFGIKCFSKTCKNGHCMNATDDTHKDFFRIYANADQSYRAHSEFLQADRYRSLKKLGKRDYKNWAIGLKKAGYATAPHYAEALITIVETLKLQSFDAQ